MLGISDIWLENQAGTKFYKQSGLYLKYVASGSGMTLRGWKGLGNHFILLTLNLVYDSGPTDDSENI